MKSFKQPKTMLRVFFLVACISLVGIILNLQGGITTKVKIGGGSITEGTLGSPRFINPVLAQSQTDKDLTKLVFGSLMSMHKGEIHYDLAESLEISEDKKTYIVNLRSDVFFHDGQKVSADDILFTINRIQDPLIKSPHFTRWNGIQIEALSNHRIQFTLPTPYSDFIHNLNIGILPKHIWDGVAPEAFIFNIHNTEPIGSGYYQVTGTQKNEQGIPSEYRLEHYQKNAHAYLRTINIKFYENQESLIKAYDDNDINAVYGVSAKNEVDLDRGDVYYSDQLPRVFGIFFNQNKQDLLKEKAIREAIKYGIDTHTLANNILSQNATPIEDLVGTPSQASPVDVQKAQSLIESKGWKKGDAGIYVKNGKQLSFSLAIPQTLELKMVSEYIKQSLLDIGIDVDIQVFEQGNLTQNIIRPRDYDAVLFGYMIEKKSDLYAFWHSSQKNDPGLNISLYTNRSVDKELDALRQDTDNWNQEKVVSEITKDIPAVFLYSPNYSYILPKNIKGISIDINNEEDRFSLISNWYKSTRRVWNIFIK